MLFCPKMRSREPNPPRERCVLRNGSTAELFPLTADPALAKVATRSGCP